MCEPPAHMSIFKKNKSVLFLHESAVRRSRPLRVSEPVICFLDIFLVLIYEYMKFKQSENERRM